MLRAVDRTREIARVGVGKAERLRAVPLGVLRSGIAFRAVDGVAAAEQELRFILGMVVAEEEQDIHAIGVGIGVEQRHDVVCAVHIVGVVARPCRCIALRLDAENVQPRVGGDDDQFVVVAVLEAFEERRQLAYDVCIAIAAVRMDVVKIDAEDDEAVVDPAADGGAPHGAVVDDAPRGVITEVRRRARLRGRGAVLVVARDKYGVNAAGLRLQRREIGADRRVMIDVRMDVGPVAGADDQRRDLPVVCGHDLPDGLADVPEGLVDVGEGQKRVFDHAAADDVVHLVGGRGEGRAVGVGIGDRAADLMHADGGVPQSLSGISRTDAVHRPGCHGSRRRIDGHGKRRRGMRLTGNHIGNRLRLLCDPDIARARLAVRVQHNGGGLARIVRTAERSRTSGFFQRKVIRLCRLADRDRIGQLPRAAAGVILIRPAAVAGAAPVRRRAARASAARRRVRPFAARSAARSAAAVRRELKNHGGLLLHVDRRQTAALAAAQADAASGRPERIGGRSRGVRDLRAQDLACAGKRVNRRVGFDAHQIRLSGDEAADLPICRRFVRPCRRRQQDCKQQYRHRRAGQAEASSALHWSHTTHPIFI